MSYNNKHYILSDCFPKIFRITGPDFNLITQPTDKRIWRVCNYLEGLDSKDHYSKNYDKYELIYSFDNIYFGYHFNSLRFCFSHLKAPPKNIYKYVFQIFLRYIV